MARLLLVMYSLPPFNHITDMKTIVLFALLHKIAVAFCNCDIFTQFNAVRCYNSF
jgi:hypothetical protein